MVTTRIVLDRAQERLNLLVRTGEIFHQTLDVSETLNNIARLAVESFADLCLFDLLDERLARLFVTASAHRDPELEDALSSVSTILYVEEFGVHPVVQVTRTGKPFFLPHIDDDVIREHAASRQHENYMKRFAYRSKIVVPVLARGEIFGALTFVRTQGSREFEQDDLTLAMELGRRAGQAVANAKLYRRERHVAETLQRAFLPSDFPIRKGIDIDTHYRPGSTEAAIGGDWYDAFENQAGQIIITIGDVTGNGIDAARLMVHVRQAIRTAALDWNEPSRIADICNRMLLVEPGDQLASAFIGILDTDTLVLKYASAGHAPPLLRLASGEIETLEPPSYPLGVVRNAHFEEHEIQIAPGSMLVLYTDGLIELSHDVLQGTREVERIVESRAFRYAVKPAEFLERAITGSDPLDDIAVLVLTFGPSQRRWDFEADDARAAYVMRNEFFTALSDLCELDDNALAACGLIYGELVGNAVRHAPGLLEISLEIQNDEVLIHAIDAGLGFDYQPQLPESVWSENGRGLFLLSQLARDVDVERIPGAGSHITITLPVTLRQSSTD